MTEGRSARPGFTLLEVVLAVALAVALVGALVGFYHHVLRVREAVAAEVERVTAVRAVMRTMTRALRSAVALRRLGQGVEGAGDRVQVATVAVPSGAVWVERTATETSPLPPEADVRIEGFRLRWVENEEGDLVVAGLERTCQRVLAAPVLEEGRQVEATLLAPEVKFLRLRYWDGSAWTEAWQGDDLPQAVEITLGLRPLPEGTEPDEYPYPTYRRVVTVPGGLRGPTGAVVRGLEGAGL